ncbi:MAG TPA: hypothetical protein VI432_00565 [Candidatus Paceibacterota bacterium]
MKIMGINKLLVYVGVIIVLALSGFFIWQLTISPEEEPVPASTGLGTELYEEAQNPLNEKLPETNPFDANANPFEKKYNPF